MEVQTSTVGKFDGNAVRIATKPEAEAYAKDLMSRWMAVTDWRVAESTDPVNYSFAHGRLVAVEKTV